MLGGCGGGCGPGTDEQLAPQTVNCRPRPAVALGHTLQYYNKHGLKCLRWQKSLCLYSLS